MTSPTAAKSVLPADKAAIHRPDRAADHTHAQRSFGQWVRFILSPLASLKLTVALFALSAFLVFAGTLVQMRHGIWTVVDEYFRTAFAWIEFRTLAFYAADIPGGFYFPGGWLLGSLLLINLLAAHTVRFTVKARGQRLWMGLGVMVIGLILLGMSIAGVFQSDVAATEGAAFWRVFGRLAQGLVVGVVLLAACIMLFQKRAGIVLLHGGIILMLFSELVTGLFAVESTMTIPEGQSVNYLDHSRLSELAFIDDSDEKTNDEAVIPQSILAAGAGRISDERLPVDVEVIEYMPNSAPPMDMARLGPPMQAKNRATTGEGKDFLILPKAEGTGVDSNQAKDAPSAYVRFFDKKSGADLGTYILSYWFYPNFTLRQWDLPQTLTVDGKTWKVYLRPKRLYTPYRVELIDFRFDRYIGTNTPKNYSSDIRLVDASADVDRTVRIWMNNPLRYAGQTFYQSSFMPGEDGTVLQVVRNHGWMIPYLSCMIVGVGMTALFGDRLIQFLRKRMSS